MTLYSLDRVTPEVAEDTWIAPDANLIGRVVVETGASVWFGAMMSKAAKASAGMSAAGAGSRMTRTSHSLAALAARRDTSKGISICNSRTSVSGRAASAARSCSPPQRRLAP